MDTTDFHVLVYGLAHSEMHKASLGERTASSQEKALKRKFLSCEHLVYQMGEFWQTGCCGSFSTTGSGKKLLK